jgi:hypothetical protein
MGFFNITIKRITNPDKGLTSAFDLYFRYDGAIIENSDYNLNSTRQLDVVDKAQAITVNAFNMDPQNEAETATYTISFLPNSNIGFQEEIVFIFPETFDPLLGKKLTCTA